MREFMDQSPGPDRVRKWIVALVGALYLVTIGSFWLFGTLAYFLNFSGVIRFAGILFLPILALPVVGKGEVAGVQVDGPVWWWWFALSLVLAAALLLAGNLRSEPQADRPDAEADIH